MSGKADLLAQATAIARSARADDVDWSREPLTERERKVRAAYLRRYPYPYSTTLSLIEMRLFIEGRGRPASDLRAALDEAGRCSKLETEREMRDELREAAEAVDAGLEDVSD